MVGGGELPLKGEFFISFQGCFFFHSHFLFKREIALFSNLYMRTLAPGRRQKAAKVKPDLRMKDALLIKLTKLQLQRGNTRTHTYAGVDTGALPDVYTGTHSITHKESLWHLVRVSGGKYLPTGIITEPLAAWPRWEPN